MKSYGYIIKRRPVLQSDAVRKRLILFCHFA